MTEQTNTIIIMSDEHSSRLMGCAGHPFVKTPNLDRLAARGTRFDNAYTNSPICVPARASFATGQFCHKTGHWDNATPYIGRPESWGHHLQRNGSHIGSIGKLHYRNEGDDVGLDFQQIPMHLVKGVGDILGCVREPMPRRWKARDLADQAGRGETAYTSYDRNIADNAVVWLADRGKESADKPWTVFVSMVAPHFPLTAPDEFYDLYKDMNLWPAKDASEDDHPWIKALRHCFVYDNFTEERTRTALIAYHGLVSFMDANVGRVLDAVDAAGLRENTRIIYTSDHGDNMGERGLWGKSNMYEESAAVPMIMAGPGVPAGNVCKTPVSLVDVFPTILHAAGLPTDHLDVPGTSLMKLAAKGDDMDRVAFSEYHAAGAAAGAFMVRKGQWKFVYYVGMEPQLFDLDADPAEVNDLGSSVDHADICADMEAELRKICDPEAVDKQARADQQEIVNRHGGTRAVLERGGFGATPAPGSEAAFVKSE